MCRQIGKRHPRRVRLHADIRRQMSGDRIGQRDLAFADHVGEQQRREDFRDGSDFEYRRSVYRTGVSHSEPAVGDGAAASRCDDADDHAHAPLHLVGAFDEDSADRGVVAEPLRRLRGCLGGSCH